MTRITNAGSRPYSSELRARQANETRTRILDATVRVMARGVASVSIPAVAAEAGVSVPTVYHHFGTKSDLLAATYPHLEKRAGLPDRVIPRTVEELSDGVRGIFERIDAFDDLARAAMASPAAEEARQLTMPDRLAYGRRIADSIRPKLRPTDRDRLARLLVVLTTSSSLRVWRDHLGATVEQAADDIDWLVRACVRATTSDADR
jgi:AcrR family transcriptional regulator